MTAGSIRGRCRVLYCFDVARAIDLARAGARLASGHRASFQHKGAALAQSGALAPLRTIRSAAPQVHAPEWGGRRFAPDVEIALYDFGALAVGWTLPLDGALEELVDLSRALYANEALTEASRAVALEVLRALGDAADGPRLLDLVEDYFVFELETPAQGVEGLLRDDRGVLARVLRAEPAPLSEQEIDSALESAVSYGVGDLALVDWLGAILVGAETTDERLVLELATIELLELRVLDSQLDRETEAAYLLFAGPRPFRASWATRHKELERIARAQADDALLHEGIDNALKLFGDDYLARLYRAAAARFHFDDYDAAIQRKLTVLERIYERLADQASRRRAEVLEWIIIALIAVDIVLYFTPLR